MDFVTDLVKFEFAYCPFSKCITDRSNTKTGLVIPNWLSMYKLMTYSWDITLAYVTKQMMI